MLDGLLAKCIYDGKLTRDEIIYLLSREEGEEADAIRRTADLVRQAHCGEGVHIRALVEFASYCTRECLYCGLRRENEQITRYRMPADEIIALAKDLDSEGMRTIVLQSGEDNRDVTELADVVRRIKAETNLRVTLSTGEKNTSEYALLKEAGADRYLIRHETANEKLYASLHPDGNLQERIDCLVRLRKLGFQVGTGSMVGLPGQTVEELADDIEFLAEFQPDMVGIGPFIPHPQTPLAENLGGTLSMTLKMVALARIVTRNALIPATTAIGSIHEYGREMALRSGADVVMPNYTPMKYRIHYDIYPNKRCQNEDPELCRGCMRRRIFSVERPIADGPGDSRKL